MLKKIVSLLLALCLAAVAFVPAFAENAAPEKKVVTWNQECQDAFVKAGYSGKFMLYTSANLILLIPTDFTKLPVDEASLAGGNLDNFQKEDGSRISIVQKRPSDEITFHSMDEVEAFMRQADPTGSFQHVVANGLDVLIYAAPAQDILIIMTLLDNGELFQVICSNIHTHQELYAFIDSSIQVPAE